MTTADPVLLAVSHGTSSAAGQRAVAALAEAVATELDAVDVRLCHVDVQSPSVTDALGAIPDDRAVVLVPLLLGAGYHVHVDLAEAVGDRTRTMVTPALGPDDRLTTVLAARLEELGERPGGPIVLVTAGSSDDRANAASVEAARRLGASTGSTVDTAYLAARTPTLPEAIAAQPAGTSAVIASYLLAPGYFHDLAASLAPGLPITRPLLDADAPHPEMVALVIDRYRDAVRNLETGS